jgi:dipeptidyl aminopeptidase/acylaminoacyl peptidase
MGWLNRFVMLTLITALAVTVMPAISATSFRPPESVVAEEVPEIPLELVETVKRYTEFRGAVMESWHPTRREMLITTRFGDVSQVHQVRAPLGARKQLTFTSEPPDVASYQPTTGDYFVFSSDIGGNEFNQNYRYDLTSKEVTLLTDGKSKNSEGVWSTKGDRIAYTSTRRNGKDSDIYLIDPRTPASDRLLATVDSGGWYPLGWSPDDRTLVVLQLISVNQSYLWLLDTTTGKKTSLIPQSKDEPAVAYRKTVYRKDGKGLYGVSDRNSEFQHLFYFDLSSRKFTDLTPQLKWDVEEFSLSKDGKWLAYVSNEAGASVLHVIDTVTYQAKTLPKLPLGRILGITWHHNNRDLGFTLTSARLIADVYSLDIVANKMERWTEGEGAVNPDNFAEAELVSWQSFDNKMISGFLYRPPAKFKGKRPVIIDIHGGPESQTRPGFLTRNNYYLNELGVAILFPNVRGSSGYGKSFLKLDNVYLREDAVKDIGALLDWIKTQPDLDADRILVTGRSYGGYMSLAVATKYSDRIRASIDIVGISNFVTFLEQTESYRRDLRRAEYGDERDPQVREFLQKISPLTNASAIKKPLFVIHGKNDPRVPVAEAEQIVKTVRKNNIPVWYLVAIDEGHGFTKKPNLDFQFYATVQFIRQYLLGPSPS